MSLETLKLEVMQQLLLTENEQLLGHMRNLLAEESTFSLTPQQKAELDELEARHARGEARFHPVEESITRVKANYSASRAV